MSLEVLMNKRVADFEAAIARDPDKFMPEMLIMCRAWGGDAADYFLKLAGAVLNPDAHMDAAKKIAIERIGRRITKVDQRPGKQRRKLDKLAVAAIEEGFDARLAERRSAGGARVESKSKSP